MTSPCGVSRTTVTSVASTKSATASVRQAANTAGPRHGKATANTSSPPTDTGNVVFSGHLQTCRATKVVSRPARTRPAEVDKVTSCFALNRKKTSSSGRIQHKVCTLSCFSSVTLVLKGPQHSAQAPARVPERREVRQAAYTCERRCCWLRSQLTNQQTLFRKASLQRNTETKLRVAGWTECCDQRLAGTSPFPSAARCSQRIHGTELP